MPFLREVYSDRGRGHAAAAATAAETCAAAAAAAENSKVLKKLWTHRRYNDTN